MKQEVIPIYTSYITLQSLLKYGGVVDTGGEGKQLIQEGRVQVNGTPCTMRGKKLYIGDVVVVDGSLELTVYGTPSKMGEKTLDAEGSLEPTIS